MLGRTYNWIKQELGSILIIEIGTGFFFQELHSKQFSKLGLFVEFKLKPKYFQFNI
jgi:hypothetical protein